MNVKDFFRKVFFVLMSVVLFTSCSDDDDNEPKPEATPKGMGVYIAVDLSQDLFSAADVYLQYIDGNGTQQVEKVTSTSIRKTVVTTNFSQQLGYRIMLKEKATNNIETETCKVSWSDASVFAVIDTDGEVFSEYAVTTQTSYTISKAKLSDWITKHADLRNVGYTVSADKKTFNSVTINWGTPDFLFL